MPNDSTPSTHLVDRMWNVFAKALQEAEARATPSVLAGFRAAWEAGHTPGTPEFEEAVRAHLRLPTSKASAP